MSKTSRNLRAFSWGKLSWTEMICVKNWHFATLILSYQVWQIISWEMRLSKWTSNSFNLLLVLECYTTSPGSSFGAQKSQVTHKGGLVGQSHHHLSLHFGFNQNIFPLLPKRFFLVFSLDSTRLVALLCNGFKRAFQSLAEWVEMSLHEYKSPNLAKRDFRGREF